MTGTDIALTTDAEVAMALDAADPLSAFREEFHLPVGRDGSPQIYLAGNSLGAIPRAAADHVNAEWNGGPGSAWPGTTSASWRGSRITSC